MLQRVLVWAVSSLFFLSLSAQDCLRYYPQETDGSFEIMTYNKKDKVESRAVYEVVERSDNQITYEATLYDKKDKEITTMTFAIYCEGDVLKVDMRNFMPANTLEQMNMEGVDVDMESTDMAFPANLTVGQSLPDADISIKVTLNGMPMLTTTSETTNRKVIAKESITTPMGTYECFVITGDFFAKMGFVKVQTSEKLFLHPEKGFLRSESYDKKGKLESYTVRTS